MFSKQIILFTCVILVLSSAGPVQSQLGKANVTPSTRDNQEFSNMKIIENLVYARTPEKKLLLDLYIPKLTSATPFPVVVWIHGGGWRGGNKAKPHALPLVKHGYVVASINYRLSKQATFPAQIYDCKSAIRWLRANAKNFHLNPDRIGVWGASAGAHLAALLGTSGSVKDLDGNLGNKGYSSRVQAVVDFYGPTDFLKMDEAGSKITHNAPDSPESRLIGAPIQKSKEKVALANPITYVSKNASAFLIVHGDKDKIVPYEQSRLLHSALLKVGVESTFYILKGGGHGRGGKFGSQELFEIVRDFFDHHLIILSSPRKAKNMVIEEKIIILE